MRSKGESRQRVSGASSTERSPELSPIYPRFGAKPSRKRVFSAPSWSFAWAWRGAEAAEWPMMKGRVLDKSKNIWNFTQNITTITDPIMEAIVDEIFKALGYLLIAGIALFAWKRADDAAESGKVKMVLGKGLLWCAGIALFASITLEHQSCEYQSDPLYGGCEYYADDGYATTEQRMATFAYFMTLLYVPVIFGAITANCSQSTSRSFHLISSHK